MGWPEGPILSMTPVHLRAVLTNVRHSDMLLRSAVEEEICSTCSLIAVQCTLFGCIAVLVRSNGPGAALCRPGEPRSVSRA
eukprot:365760-Chlamydomonas_euryale.AAC.3